MKVIGGASLFLLSLALALPAQARFHCWIYAGERHCTNLPAEYVRPDGTLEPEWRLRHLGDAELVRSLTERNIEQMHRQYADERRRRMAAADQESAAEAAVPSVESELDALYQKRSRLQREEAIALNRHSAAVNRYNLFVTRENRDTAQAELEKAEKIRDRIEKVEAEIERLGGSLE